MKQLILIILLVAVWYSCEKETYAKFEITNSTETILDSISIHTTSSNLITSYLKLAPGESEDYLSDMTDLPMADGAYILTYRMTDSGIKKQKEFGYFTNGYPLEDLTEITIEQDSVIIDYMDNRHY